MIQTTIKEYYLLTALKSAAMGIIAAMYVTFLIHKGLNLFEVNIVNFTFFTTLFLCEIPTGAFADVFGRKASYIASNVLLTIGMIVYAISDSFAGFVLAEILSAVGATFASGAFKAWFVDKLHHHGYEEDLDPIFAKAKQISQAVGILAAMLGAWLADISMSLPWALGAGLFILTGAVACFIKEEYFIPQKFSFTDGIAAMKQTVRTSIRCGMESANIRFILLLVPIQVFATQGPNMQWQPFFMQSLPGKTYLGYMWAAIALSMMAGAWLAPRFRKYVGNDRKALAYCQLAIGFGIATTALSGIMPIAVMIFLLHEVARGAFEPAKDAYLHKNIHGNKERATIDSFESLAHHGGGMIGLLVSGMIALHMGIPWTWGIAGTVLVAVTLLLMKNGRKEK